MSRVRGVDGSNDWIYGKGKNDYKSNNNAIAQNIKTRLQSFLGDCFFSVTDGIDWYNLLGNKDEVALTLSVSSVILNTTDVIGLVELNLDLNPNTRRLTVQYEVTTIYSTFSSTVTIDPLSLL